MEVAESAAAAVAATRGCAAGTFAGDGAASDDVAELLELAAAIALK